MNLSQEYNELPKKYVKKLFHKPHKAYCKKCNGKLLLLPEDEHPGEILFRCMSPECGQIVDVTKYKKKYSINKAKIGKMMARFDNVDTSNMSIEIVRYRIKNQYYIIDDDTTYNPVTKMKYANKKTTMVLDKEHKELLDIIKSNIEKQKDA